ncbi:MAG: DNA methylase, partial [Lachnospiraceae bacterium]|nr:DNA methylase [Lachnospiraceae bacterium]
MAVHTLTGRTDSTQNGDDRKEGRRVYAAIDLKSFYASVECRERGLDPLKTLLVVADLSRTEKTICLAVSPSLKAYGIPGRPRLFEVVQAVERINRDRLAKSGLPAFTGSSSDADELRTHPEYRLEYIVARPRMQLYMDYSAKIYQTYLKFVAPEDIFPYSVDEVFIDLTSYRKLSGMDAKALTRRMIREVLKETGITATAGVGTNMYLAKAAMDIVAKHMPADEYGVRMAFCDEMQYRRRLWNHRPLTDFWRVGKGYAGKLADHGIFTMGDIARTSLVNEELLYHLFGVNAELLIDHAWGWEPCTIADVKNFRPPAKSMSEGQVLQEPYSFA